MKVGRYAAFNCYRYYPTGGAGDCIGRFDDLEQAKAETMKDIDPTDADPFDEPSVWDLMTDELHTRVGGQWKVAKLEWAGK